MPLPKTQSELITYAEKLEADVTALTAENTKLKDGMANFQAKLENDFAGKLAAQLAQHGIRANAVNMGADGTASKGAKKPTATERVLAAKGFASLDELYAANAENAAPAPQAG